MIQILRHFRSRLKLALPAAAAALSLHAHAATFTLESTTVILDEQERRVAFNVKNEGNEPILLLSKLDDLDKDDKMSQRILIAPPIARIDPGQSQQVNFALKKGAALDREYLLKASFEGVAQRGRGSMTMPVRQEVGFIVQPSAVPQNRTPWQTLQLTSSDRQLVVTNPGPHVVRLGPELRLLPGDKRVVLKRPYMMPGETRTFDIEGAVEQIGLTPLSRYGLVQQMVTLPVSR
ncbi:fimbria/pilus chaperone family protein [Burkholderia ubonensis]|uniref:Fimbrial protein n=1 Tax=Burkholderia ubonensis TaxID=101571 RepID=A0AB74CYD7_9BURK|nr:fimbria/pilus chaperone family protein [Burkholderia ubonensis]PAJ77768.1 fimbrial protein [Burkholderia ubonensis]PAJ85549.1 fimbrial protein [Burkholderia ubonensis]PAJ95177.1 fimbrial protein [Burkholderia ubonensis]PAJ99606.1 fimbrial protein [Burkholderia ubonensis]PAK06356.1 fimbrial protein [Burkholderia ubonensis]